MRNAAFLLICCTLLGCFGGGLSHLSDEQLREKVLECDYLVDPTAPEIQVCKNYKRECKSRNKSGRFVC